MISRRSFLLASPALILPPLIIKPSMAQILQFSGGADSGGGGQGILACGSYFPDATTTGVPAGTTLTTYSGPWTITTPNTIIDSKNITGTITVNTTGVIIRKCKINANGGFYGVLSDFDVAVQDCEIYNSNQGNLGISTSGSALRCNVYGFENGISCNTIQDCYIHDLANDPNSDPHIDAIPIQGGSNYLVQHNTLIAYNNSAVFIKCDFSAISNVNVTGNLMINAPPSGKSGYGYAVYSDNTPGRGISGVSFTNNVIQNGVFGYSNFVGNTPVWTGNKSYGSCAAI